MNDEIKAQPEIRLWFDRGLRAAAVNPDDLRAVMLADFIESDVQACEIASREWLEWLARVQRGDAETEGGIGNAFDVTIDRDGVLIANAIFEDWPSYRYSHDEFRCALEQVLTALQADRETYPPAS